MAVACHGRAVLALCASRAFDIVITDIYIPGMDGIELLLALRERQPDLAIMAMLGGGTDVRIDQRPAAGLLGATRVLSKPLDLARAPTSGPQFILKPHAAPSAARRPSAPRGRPARLTATPLHQPTLSTARSRPSLAPPLHAGPACPSPRTGTIFSRSSYRDIFIDRRQATIEFSGSTAERDVDAADSRERTRRAAKAP